MYIVGKMPDMIYGEVADFRVRKSGKKPVNHSLHFALYEMEH